MVTIETLMNAIPALGVIVALVYYTLTIRNQNRTRQAQLFMNIYNQSFANQEWLDAHMKVMRTHWESYEEYMQKIDWNSDESDSEFIRAANLVYCFYEGLGVFVKEGLVDIRMIALTMTWMTRTLWEKIAPMIYESRKRMNYPRMLSEFEYLYDELMKYIEEHPELKT